MTTFGQVGRGVHLVPGRDGLELQISDVGLRLGIEHGFFGDGVDMVSDALVLACVGGVVLARSTYRMMLREWISF